MGPRTYHPPPVYNPLSGLELVYKLVGRKSAWIRQLGKFDLYSPSAPNQQLYKPIIVQYYQTWRDGIWGSGCGNETITGIPIR
jgi:hypothetical protein